MVGEGAKETANCVGLGRRRRCLYDQPLLPCLILGGPGHSLASRFGTPAHNLIMAPRPPRRVISGVHIARCSEHPPNFFVAGKERPPRPPFGAAARVSQACHCKPSPITKFIALHVHHWHPWTVQATMSTHPPTRPFDYHRLVPARQCSCSRLVK